MAPWTVAHQLPLSMEFSRQEYWSGLPCPSPGDLPDLGIEPGSVESALVPALNLHCRQILYQLSCGGSPYFTSVWNECTCAVVWTFFGSAFLWDWNESDLFQFCGHCWAFKIFWYIECSTFTASSFRIWKSSAGIPSPPLALFVVMLPKAHLTLHSRISGSRWVITPLWLSGSLRFFFFFLDIVLCIPATSSSYLFFLLSPYHFCPLLSPSLHEMFSCYL